MSIQKHTALLNPLIRVLRELGGSASIQELENAVGQYLQLSEADMGEIHRGNQTRLSYNLAWARTYLKKYGILDNSARGVWAFTEKGNNTEAVDASDVLAFVQQQSRIERESEEEAEDNETLLPSELRWQDVALDALKAMPPDAFERLCQRVLRESGFIQVEVTGRSGDGGIDGRGVVKLGGILSFHVIFQCKRYSDNVSAPAIRDFRGAMVGRADKGLFITTGTFTRAARAEAQRDGAPPLDLIDGDELVAMLKQMRLGIDIREIVTEDVVVNKDWFGKI